MVLAGSARGVGWFGAGCGLLSFAQDKVLVLFLHVLDNDPVERPKASPIVDRGARLGRVDVDLYRPRVTYHQRAVTHRGNGLTNLVHVQPFALDDELDVVAVAFLAVWMQDVEVHGCSQVDIRVYLFTSCVAQHSLQDDEQTLPAGVDHARFGQHGQQRRSARDRCPCLADHVLQDVFQVVAAGSGGHGCIRRLARDGQNGALYRLDDPFVSGRRCLAQRRGKLHGIESLDIVQRSRKPTKNLG